MNIEVPSPSVIDLTAYPRASHFRYFLNMGYAYVGMTVQADITEFYHWQKQNGVPFFLAFLWCAARAANRCPPSGSGSGTAKFWNIPGAPALIPWPGRTEPTHTASWTAGAISLPS